MKTILDCNIEQTKELLKVTTDKIEFCYNLTDCVYSLHFVKCEGEPISNIGFCFNINSKKYKQKEVSKNGCSNVFIEESQDCFGGLRVAISRPFGEVVVSQEFRLLPGKDYILAGLALEGEDFIRSSYMAPVTCHGKVCDIPNSKRYRLLSAPYDNDMWNRYQALEPQDCGSSFELTSAYDAATYRGYIIGSVTHEHWKTAIDTHGGYDGLSELILYGGATSAQTRDVMPHGAVVGKRVEAPLAFIGYYSDFRMGLQEYGAVNAQYKPALKWDNGVPFGWNSWACAGADLSFERYENAGETIAALANKGLGSDQTAYVNFDACWGKLSQQELETAVKNAHARGQKAGIYGTPFAIWSSEFDRPVEYTDGKYTYRDILSRDNEGCILPAVDGGYSVDPTHPGNVMRVEGMMRFAVDMGFDYLKVDFMAHGARECVHYRGDIHTGTEAYCFGLERMCELVSQEKIGRSFFIDFSIAPVFPHGYAHARRVSCDAFGQLEDTEYMLNSLTYAFWQNNTVYRYNDPDHIVLYQSFGRPVTSVKEAQSRLNAAVISGTVMLFSDDYRIPEALERMSLLLTPKLLEIAQKGETFIPVEMDTGNRAARSFIRDDGDVLYLAIFNYTHENITHTVNSEILGDLPETPIFDSLDKTSHFSGKSFTVELSPAESVILCCEKNLKS